MPNKANNIKTRYIVFVKDNKFRILSYFPESGDMCRRYGTTTNDASEFVKSFGIVEAVNSWTGKETWLRNVQNPQEILEKFIKSADNAKFKRLAAFDVTRNGSVRFN